MHRTALGLSAFLTLIVPGTTSLAQQIDRLAASVPVDCGYVCIFASSTEPIESIGRTAAVHADGTQWSLALAQAPRPRAVVDGSASSDFTSPTGF